MRTWHTLSPSPLPIQVAQTDVFHLALFVTVTPVFRPPAVPSAIGLPGDESRSARARRRVRRAAGGAGGIGESGLEVLGPRSAPRGRLRPRRPPGGGGRRAAARRDDELNAADAGAHASLGGAAAGGEPRLPELRLEVRREESALRHLHLLARTEVEGWRVVTRWRRRWRWRWWWRRRALPFLAAAAGDQEGDEARERERAAHRAADDGDERLTL